jgi:hypothetical protein
MTRLALALACLFAAELAVAQPVILAGYTCPAAGAFTQVPEGKETRLRGAQTLQLGVLPGETLSFTVFCHRVGRYESPAKWRLLDAAGEALRTGEVPRGKNEEVTVADAKPGVYTLAVDAKLNAYSVRTPLRHLTMTAGGSSALRIIYQVPKLYFWVPTGAKQVRVAVKGQGNAEQAAYTVRQAGGTVLAEGTSLKDNGETAIPVSAANRGQIWSLEVGKLGDYTFEDVSITLDGDLPPVVAEDPARLLVPLLSAFAQPDGDNARFGLRLNAPPDLLVGKRLHYTVQEIGAAKPVEDKMIQDLTSGVFTTVLPGPGFVHARMSGELLTADGTVVVQSTAKLAMAHGKRYVEIENVEDAPAAQPSWADIQTGYLVFQRSEPGDIRPNSHPREDELRTELKVRVTPGEFETVYFALQPLRELPTANVSVGSFANEAGKAPGISCDLRTVRCWPQMTDWRSTTFHIIPELLEKRDSMDLRKGVPQQYASILHIPADTPAGTYSADVEVTAGGNRSRAAKLVVEVLPYTLQNPPGIVWGLYPDSGRWSRFDNAQIAAELKAFREHGMTALMLYPLGAVDWKWENGKLSADFSRFRNQMGLYKASGLGGPMVISIQGGEGFISRLTGYKREENEAKFWDAYQQMLRLLKQESVDQHWPEFCLHSVDEPHSGPKLEAAIRTLKVIKGEGFKTFNTCYGKAVREALDPYLDYRCYNNIGFLSMRTPEGTEELRKETLASHDAFWWYGTGCYTNGALIQDGNVLVNRFMGGVHFWRTKATGCWSWTFLRPKNSAYDDFDGSGHREGKDACIAYPTPDGKALVPTLQWEGLREGVDDYRYLYTLKAMIDRVGRSGQGRAVQLAKETQTKLDGMISDLAWNCRPGGVTTADLDRFRQRVIDLTLPLAAIR